MKASITDKLLRSLAAKNQPHPPIWDKSLSGFGIRVGQRGSISFFAMRRQRGGNSKPIRIGCGSYPLVTLAEARERARAILRDLHDGIDPRQREADRQEAEAAELRNTYRAVAEDFITRHVGRKRTARAIELRIRRELIRRWGERPIVDIGRADVIAMLDEIIDRGHQGAAHQTFVYGRRLHNWAIARGVVEHSPFDRLNASDLIGRKQPRQRVLAQLELKLIWAATGGTPEEVYPNGQYIRLLLLLGTRIRELAQATWPEIDLFSALWTIPPARMKNDETHVIPLPSPAVEILKSLPRFATVDYLFSARGNRPLNDFGRIKNRLDGRIAELNDGKPIAPWTFHDLRRTFRTGLSTLGIAPHIAELCIAHRQSGLARVYDLHRFEAEKREAFNRWAAHLRSIAEPPPANVVPLRVPA